MRRPQLWKALEGATLDKTSGPARGRGFCSSVVAASAVMLTCAGPASANDGNAWLRFGPGGEGSGTSYSTSAASYDKAFIREWESNPPRGFPTLSAANVEATKQAIKRYEAIVKDGGWSPLGTTELAPGASGKAVEELRERLRISGDLKGDSYYPDSYEETLETAVKRFQAANGLTPTGVTDKRTLAALNVSAQSRLKQLKQGLERLRQFAGSTGKGKYVVVNIPAAQVEAVENGRVVSRHAGVVGKADRKTPLLKSSIHELNFNPVWRLPPTVVHKDLIPKGQQMQQAGKNVLVKFGIDAYDGNGRKLDPEKIKWNSAMPQSLSYSQQPGKDNPLGFLKINFHNEYSVYMHDTPSESLFGRNFRAASSGCIRVQNIESLAQWLLEEQGIGKEQIAALKESRERKDVKLKRPVPLYFVYVTAWATEDGVVQFRRDLYQKDGAGETVSAY